MQSGYVQPVVANYPGYQVVVPNGGSARGIEYAKRNKATFFGLAVTQLVLGIFLVIIGIICLPICFTWYYCGYSYSARWTTMSTNIWGGTLIILFAAFGIVQSRNATRCKITTNLTMSIIGAVSAAVFVILEAIAASWSWWDTALVVLHSLATTMHFALFILFIVSSSYAGVAQGCCAGCGTGCCCDDQQQVVVSFIPGGQQQQQVLISPNGQVVNQTPVALQGPQAPVGYNFPQPPQYSAHTGVNLFLPGNGLPQSSSHGMGGVNFVLPGSSFPQSTPTGMGAVNQGLVADETHPNTSNLPK